MPNCSFSSIDQNSSPLWDAIPKLLALSSKNLTGVHFLEDIDVAFTRRGALPGEGLLSLKQERYYRGGVSDWGAALFYTDFLGRIPLDVTDFEHYTGWTTAALSRRLNLTVDELYDYYSYSDNWQLIGPSYADNPLYHRVIGDLKTAEVRQFLLELMLHARRDVLAAFPESAAQSRTNAWFDREDVRVKQLLDIHRDGSLVDLYKDWLTSYLSDRIQVMHLSELLQIDISTQQLLQLFLQRYDEMASCYNQAILNSDVGLNLLDTSQGELPAFIVMKTNGRLLRASLSLRENHLIAGDRSWQLDGSGLPLAKMQSDGIVSIAGKALLLVLQVRMKPYEHALALPCNGSLYMPAVHEFERLLRQRGLLDSCVCPISRIKFNFLEQMHNLETLIHLPEHLAPSFGVTEMRANEFAAAVPGIVHQSRRDLAQMQQAESREIMRRRLFAAQKAEWEQLHWKRKELASTQEGREEASRIWQYQKKLERTMLQQEVDWIQRQLQVSALDYYNSRGALIPWSIALGGDSFCEKVIAEAVIYEETC